MAVRYTGSDLKLDNFKNMEGMDGWIFVFLFGNYEVHTNLQLQDLNTSKLIPTQVYLHV